MKRLSACTLALCAALSHQLQAQRSELRLEKGWRFTRQDQASFSTPDYNDSKWSRVTVPHDWAIYGPFSFENDKQHLAIAQDGQKEAMEHAGRTGGLPFVGVGWYRRSLDIPQDLGDRRVFLRFDGGDEPRPRLRQRQGGRLLAPMATTRLPSTSPHTFVPAQATRLLSAWRTSTRAAAGTLAQGSIATCTSPSPPPGLRPSLGRHRSRPPQPSKPRLCGCPYTHRRDELARWPSSAGDDPAPLPCWQGRRTVRRGDPEL